MSYLSMIIALFKTLANDTGVPGSAWLDLYLNNLVAVEEWFLSFWLVLLGSVMILLILFGLISLLAKRGEGVGMSIGCLIISALFVVLPLLEWFTLMLARAMANSVDPTGIINAGKFWVCTVIYILIGAG